MVAAGVRPREVVFTFDPETRFFGESYPNHPDHRVTAEKFGEINRRVTRREYAEAVAAARTAGLQRLDERHPLAALMG